ncbi:MAG: hypothetical protein NW226_21120 [Microscillaceae bacterium]|nr:hypothetical protein [Microscillaceae bacterium]
MNIRIAKKILKSQDQLKYTKNQLKKAETIQRRKAKSIAKAVAGESSDQEKASAE